MVEGSGKYREGKGGGSVGLKIIGSGMAAAVAGIALLPVVSRPLQEYLNQLE